MSNTQIRFLAEWEEQDAVLIAWPHQETDWRDILPEAEDCYLRLALAILEYEPLVIITREVERIDELLKKYSPKHPYTFLDMQTNDTWIRDYGPLSMEVGEGQKAIADFTFNGWGMKFAANRDNLVTRCLYLARFFEQDVQLLNRLILTLEGGSVESDGLGSVLSTTNCLLEPNRNAGFDTNDLLDVVTESLGADRLMLLKEGSLEGDDTDGHIDTLARFIDEKTIAYVSCNDPYDSHYHELNRMREELEKLTQKDGSPYTLIPLPLPDAIYNEGERLPATYANFLFVNGALLVPTYDQEKDQEALESLRQALPDRAVIGVDCRTLIKQHGSLHCATMQLPKGYLNKKKLSR